MPVPYRIFGKNLSGALRDAGVAALAMVCAAGLSAQPSSALPSVVEVVEAVASTADRSQRLQNLLVVDELLATLGGHDDLSSEELQQRALELRTRLADIRPLIGDAEAWGVQQDLIDQSLQLELDQHGLRLWPDGNTRDQRLLSLARRSLLQENASAYTASLLPAVLQDVEVRAPLIWQSLLDWAAANETVAAWLAAWLEQDHLALGSAVVENDANRRFATDEAINQALKALTAELTHVGAVDPTLSWALKRDLLLVAAAAEPEQRSGLRAKLALTKALEGLQDRHYLRFAHYLLDVGVRLVDEGQWGTDARPLSQAMLGPLAETLPAISSAFAREFADVDARINSVVAAVFNTVSRLQENADQDWLAVRRELVDASAQLNLMLPDAGYYFDQPVRNVIREEIDICISLAASQTGESAAISKEQFDGCIAGFNDLVARNIRRPALAGDGDGPFGEVQLRRELVLSTWQRINFILGLLERDYGQQCRQDAAALPNPLEWALLANTMRWFADQWPVYFQTPESEQQLLEMMTAGEEINRRLSSWTDCLAGQGAAINDIVLRELDYYRRQSAQLMNAVTEVQQEYRSAYLKPGADVQLTGDTAQETHYRPEMLTIGPCDATRICEMADELEANRALVERFPSSYLLADQTRLGDIDICYDQVEWVDRRSELARANDTNVANYFGRLSYLLKGRFQHDGQETDVFTIRFTGDQEYHYLFAANDPELLQDSCPMEHVGTSIVTPLTGSSLPIVPNRLTYLASSRTLPSRLFGDNWQTGAEWRDWFVTGNGVETLAESDGEELTDRINSHLRELYRGQESAVYGSLLSQPLRLGGDDSLSLAEQLTAVNVAKARLKAFMHLFYPNAMMFDDAIRGAFEGQRGLLDFRGLRRLRDATTPIREIATIGQARSQYLEQHWTQEPETLRRTGSVSAIVGLAYLQLSDLHQRYFVQPPEPAVSEPETIEPPAGESPIDQSEREATDAVAEPGATDTTNSQ